MNRQITRETLLRSQANGSIRWKVTQYGSSVDSCIADGIGYYFEDNNNVSGEQRTVLGWELPYFQREFVWTLPQKIKLIENVLLGVNIGSYTINQNKEGTYNWLLDGQQRMKALEDFIFNGFPVFGLYFKDFNKQECRLFLGHKFNCLTVCFTKLEDIVEYYNIMNFGGTPHDLTQIAKPPQIEIKWKLKSTKTKLSFERRV